MPKKPAADSRACGGGRGRGRGRSAATRDGPAFESAPFNPPAWDAQDNNNNPPAWDAQDNSNQNAGGGNMAPQNDEYALPAR